MATSPAKDDFQASTATFLEWVQRQPGTIISPKIKIADMRELNAGRGIGKISSSNMSILLIDHQLLQKTLKRTKSFSASPMLLFSRSRTRVFKKPKPTYSSASTPGMLSF